MALQFGIILYKGRASPEFCDKFLFFCVPALSTNLASTIGKFGLILLKRGASPEFKLK
jgi:hypothetical protein